MSTTNPPPIRINIWSDYVCPFCYLELPVMERLQQEFGEDVTVIWRAFELRPEPVPTLDPKGEYLQEVWSNSVYPMAQERGMVLRLPPVQPRSRRALEAAEFARSEGAFAEMHQNIFQAFFEAGKNIDDVRVLEQCATAAGLDPVALRRALQEGRFTSKVLEDERLAAEFGVNGVPALIIDNGSRNREAMAVVHGAQPYELIKAKIAYVATLPVS